MLAWVLTENFPKLELEPTEERDVCVFMAVEGSVEETRR